MATPTQLPGLTQQQTALAQLGLTTAAGALSGGPQNSKTLQTSTPQIPINVQPLQTGILGAALSGLNAGTNLSGYTSGGLQNINNATNAQQNILKNTLAARGLTYSSPLATAESSNIAQQGAGQQTSFLNEIPLLRQQLLQQQLSGAVNAFRAQPYGQQITGTASITQPGGILAGLLAGAAAGTNLYGQAAGGNQTSTGPSVGQLPTSGGSGGGVYDPTTGGSFPGSSDYLSPSDPFNPNGILGQYYLQQQPQFNAS